MLDPSDSSSATHITKTTESEAQSGTVIPDSSHPFYLHPSYSLGMLLVNTVFDGKGYVGWRRGILITLSTKNKVKFIDVTFFQPTISCDSFKPWARTNDMVISWLLNTLTKEIVDSREYPLL